MRENQAREKRRKSAIMIQGLTVRLSPVDQLCFTASEFIAFLTLAAEWVPPFGRWHWNIAWKIAAAAVGRD